MRRLQGSLTLDTGVLVEYLTGSTLGAAVRDYFAQLGPNERAHCSLYALSEVFYILCRLKGKAFAQERITQLMQSNVIAVYSSPEWALKTGELKCIRAISLADCGSIATAALTNTKALFIEEEELKAEIAKKPFEVEISFVDQWGK